jgi:hypothetical protein
LMVSSSTCPLYRNRLISSSQPPWWKENTSLDIARHKSKCMYVFTGSKLLHKSKHVNSSFCCQKGHPFNNCCKI